jgi:hypothetical protein
MCAGMDAILAISLTQDQQGWVALVIGLIACGYLLFRPRFKKKDPLEKPAFSSLAAQRSVERQMQNLLVELSEMARQMNAQVDTRAAKLQELIKHADERIAELKKLEGEPPEPKDFTPPSEPAPAPPVEERLPVVELDPRHAEIYSLADQGKGAKEIATRLGRPSGEVELILALRRGA